MSAQRGASLVEAMVALAVLGVGTASVSSLITSIGNARRQMAFQTTSLELFNRLNAEIQSASCLVFPPNTLPDASSADGAFLVPPDTWQDAPAGSVLTTLGTFDGSDPAKPLSNGVPVRIEYRLAPVPAVGNAPPAFDVLVRVRELRKGAANDAADVMSRYDIRTWPIRKSCALRTVAESRGGFP